MQTLKSFIYKKITQKTPIGQDTTKKRKINNDKWRKSEGGEKKESLWKIEIIFHK